MIREQQGVKDENAGKDKEAYLAAETEILRLRNENDDSKERLTSLRALLDGLKIEEQQFQKELDAAAAQ